MRKSILSLMFVCLGLVFICSNSNIFAQKTFILQDWNNKVKLAQEHFNQKNYSDAYRLYADLSDSYKDIAVKKVSKETSMEASEIFFNKALCAYYLMNNDVDILFKEYKTLFPYGDKYNRADFYIANWYMQKAEFLKALNTYQNMDTLALSSTEKDEYNYKLGFCYFLQNMNDKAKISFAKVKDKDSKYSPVAKYYYGHILYSEGQYKLALNEFEALKKDRNFSKVVPYYIAQIYYFEEDYEKLLEMAPSLSKNSANSKRATELNRMIADAYYKMNRYDDAIPYIQKSIESNNGINREDNYLIGYCLMETGRYTEAIPYLKNASNENDNMAQNSLYSLGYCYLEQKDTVSAFTAYKGASEMNFDKEIQEDALFSYAKLSISLPSPYNEQLIKTLNEYIKNNQKKNKKDQESSKVNEARMCLTQLYEKSHNYAAALEQMDNMKNRNAQMNKIYVKTCLNRGIELFNKGEYSDCITTLNKIDNNVSSATDNILASSKYIKAEAYYRTDTYKQSIQTLNSYYTVPNSDKNEYRASADYLMGYNLFKQKKYAQAKDYFEKTKASNISANIKADASIRLADCHYMLKNYDAAVKSYNEFIATGGSNADYATYQKAMANGAAGNQKEKANTLQSGIKNYPNSTYISAMTYELANTYLALNENNKALDTYKQVVNKYPNSAYRVDCLGRIGMLQYQAEQYDAALNTLDKVVKEYPNTQQAKAALSTIKNIYIDKGTPDEYLTYANKVGNIKVSKSEQEDMLYQSAENKYMEEKYKEAEPNFKSYLAKFPNGKYFEKSEYYLADCLMRLQDTMQAASYYYKVSERQNGQYIEKATLNAAKIYEGKDNQKAIILYSKLDNIASTATNRNKAKVGLMNAYYETEDYSKAINTAESILKIENIDSETKDRTNFVLANSYLETGNTEKGEEYFNILSSSTNNRYASQAQYTLALLEYSKGNLDKSEKTIRQMAKNGADDYYLAKAFILWSDIFVQKGNDFQAKQTLKSIIENYDGDSSVLKEAKDKLDSLENKQIQENEKNEEKLQEQQNSVDEVIIEDNK
ncbi:MAG: tetratricopeptide repeat protein [Bacteroidales bacterium]|nr:tetratricopeptide repeat protein [Bacteroidales bacterium]